MQDRQAGACVEARSRQIEIPPDTSAWSETQGVAAAACNVIIKSGKANAPGDFVGNL